MGKVRFSKNVLLKSGYRSAGDDESFLGGVGTPVLVLPPLKGLVLTQQEEQRCGELCKLFGC